MNEKINVNRAINIMAIAIITIFMVLMANYTLISLAIVPIIFAIFLVNEKLIDSIILLFLLGLISFVLSFTAKINVVFLTALILGLIISITIKLDLNDTDALIIVFILSALFLNIFYYYLIRTNAIDISKVIDQVVSMLKNEGLAYPREILEKSFRNIPAILAIIGFIYALIALKTTRNYLNYKDESFRDFSKINTLKLTIREVVIGLLLALLLIGGAKYVGLDQAMVRANAISIGISLLQINGIFTMDYVIEKKQSKVYRIFTWILVFLLFSFLSLFFLILGGIDLIFNLRGALYARKK
ncbi:MAG: DUF2232 domain-containing protein [Peptoniphilaceae bacterium]|nr:DUF2232 domain-containing protein [Peptoniphilaceae bacterium]MDY6018199.1 DUF2232 domain-containing protein [Anaerococcus sp.]